MNFLSTTKAAKKAGCSPDTIRRACQNEDLQAEMHEGKRGLVWRVKEESLVTWIAAREAEKQEKLEEFGLPETVVSNKQDGTTNARPHEDSSTVARQAIKTESATQDDSSKVAEPEETSSAAVPLEVFEATQRSLDKALEVASEQREDRLDAERRAAEAEERAFRVARQMQALMDEVGSQKRLLSENSESLIEQRAATQEYEAKLNEIEQAKEQEKLQFEELYRHNAEEKARYEKEREEMLSRVKEAEAQATKFEKMPKWVRKLFGT